MEVKIARIVCLEFTNTGSVFSVSLDAKTFSCVDDGSGVAGPSVGDGTSPMPIQVATRSIVAIISTTNTTPTL